MDALEDAIQARFEQAMNEACRGTAVWYPGDDDTEPELDPWGYPDHPHHDTYEEQAGDR